MNSGDPYTVTLGADDIVHLAAAMLRMRESQVARMRSRWPTVLYDLELELRGIAEHSEAKWCITVARADSNPDAGRMFYTQTEAARRLGVDRSTIRRWIDSGQLETIVVGGVRRVPAGALARLNGGTP